MGATIQVLKKVTLSLVAKTEPGKCSTNAPPIPLVFIYGVGSDGLCPFETALWDKHEGEKLVVSVKATDVQEYFGHLFHTLCHMLGKQIADGTIDLEIEVTGVTDADNREVVQAVAKALSHGGCGTSCGCGCGC
ncbi:hypothetical protein JWG42_15155 [Desulfoprunum benzoelyticum]|uniref:FKBP-type peptidyl-prolyl cis-trans isomerase 2 n=1 Tax=Desulfoprunum benzoelyticum TaxID=1506996 RepID=A0A840UXD4_9BACT|nr:hypothetical protein [Desulfoprunum benzoelyticum]MBB5349593.1 FKBP-type peptidyl-prolyl cis-trans isomerase 2 [Desulfoprunum benzoelyticum]MBM9531497.1 hypothetical protein [Desulfoprunum benzoelyticum]